MVSISFHRVKRVRKNKRSSASEVSISKNSNPIDQKRPKSKRKRKKKPKLKLVKSYKRKNVQLAQYLGECIRNMSAKVVYSIL